MIELPQEILAYCALWGGLGGLCNIFMLAIDPKTFPVRKSSNATNKRNMLNSPKRFALVFWFSLVETVSLVIHKFYEVPKWILIRVMISVITGIFYWFAVCRHIGRSPRRQFASICAYSGTWIYGP